MMLLSIGMQMSYFRIQKSWTQPSLRMLLPLTEHEIYIFRHHHIHTMQFTPWKQLRTTVLLVFASCPPHEKKTSHERWNRVWFRSPPIILFVRHYHYSFTVPVPLSLYPISPFPCESTRLRKTGTIWKQWNHMRVDSHWTFTHNARAYTALLRMFTVRRWFDSARTSCMLAINNKKNGWKELIISGIIDCGTPCMTRTPANWIMDWLMNSFI